MGVASKSGLPKGNSKTSLKGKISGGPLKKDSVISKNSVFESDNDERGGGLASLRKMESKGSESLNDRDSKGLSTSHRGLNSKRHQDADEYEDDENLKISIDENELA